VVEASAIRAEGGKLLIQGKPYKLTEHAHGQLAQKLEIPQAYYFRMLESGHTDLLAQKADDLQTAIDELENIISSIEDIESITVEFPGMRNKPS
jgi:hypothetical protein